jgi:thiol-disulfide isomerase/thioredoxin
MKKFSLSVIAMTMAAIGLQAQVNLEIKGTAPANIKYIYIKDVADKGGPDSVAVISGKFSYKNTAEENAFIEINTANKAYDITVIADNTPIEVDLTTSEVKGSALNMRFNGYEKKLSALTSTFYTYYNKYKTATSTEKESLRDSLNSCEEQIYHIMNTALVENPDNVIPAAFLNELAQGMTYSELKAALDASHPYANHRLVDPAHVMLKQKSLRADGTIFHDIEMADEKGTMHKLSEYCGKGKYVMLDFWASWCGPCRMEMPNVVTNYGKYHSKGFEIIGLSFDKDANSWKNAIVALGMKWIQLSDLKGWKSIAASTYGITAIPANVIIDPQGKIIANDLRGENLGVKLKEIYGF